MALREFRVYQITLTELADRTGLIFADPIHEADDLFFTQDTARDPLKAVSNIRWIPFPCSRRPDPALPQARCPAGIRRDGYGVCGRVLPAAWRDSSGCASPAQSRSGIPVTKA